MKNEMRSVIGSAAVIFLLAATSLSGLRNDVAGELQSGNQLVANGSAAKTNKAKAVLESKSGSTLTGEVTFTEKQGGVEVNIKLKGAAPGPHGIHLHDKGDCSAADAASAGGHFNPDKTSHGAPDSDPHHSGDLGNITVGAKGTGELKLMVKGLTVADGAHSVVGHAFVVHASADDFKSQPAGNSGARFACGVVKAVN